MADVIIVGAGPAGSTLATLLARRGLDTLLLDKATFPREKTCGDYLSPGTVRLLDRLELLDAVQTAGARRLWGMTVTSPDGTSFTAAYPGRARGDGIRPYALSLRRSILDALLLDRARNWGVKCLEGFGVTDLVREGERVCGVQGIGPEGPETYRGKIVVGADGRASVVARRLGLHRAHPTLRRMALVAYYEGGAGPRDHGAISVGDGAYCILNPVDAGMVSTSIVLDQAMAVAWKGRLEDLFERKLREFPAAAMALEPMRRCSPVRCLGPLAFRARRTSAAGALLIGDATGFYDPFTGAGVYDALRGAELAAHEIAAALNGGGPVPLRFPRFDRRLRQARASKRRLEALLQAIIRRPHAASAAARLLRRLPSLADLLLGVIGDLPTAWAPAGPQVLTVLGPADTGRHDTLRPHRRILG